jgi:2-polyprenyl-6-methoxyphenol hydroxylase-like FAD-dependent oxidoreductase
MRPGHRRYNFVWYRPANAAALADLLTDASGHVNHLSIPPKLIRPELIARMRADAERLLAPQFAALVQATRLPLLQPIYDLEAQGTAAGRVALVGDAAFVARPHVGAGVTKAAMDAQALAEALDAAPVPQALRAFERSRLPVNRRIVHHARLLGAALQGEELPGASAYQTPEAVMAETALLGFLER